jgi:hypothetical protein
MAESSSSPFGPLLREAVVIVASILVAFAIDAWWDTRQERDQTEAYMDALAEDFQAARAELDRAVGLHEWILDAADAIMAWEAAGADPAGCEDLRYSLALLLAFPTFDPPGGTVETILGSGRADLIEDPALLRELTRWTSLVQDFQTEEGHANAHLADMVVPMMQGAMDMKRVITIGAYTWSTDDEDPVPCAFLASQSFQSVVFRHWVWHRAALEEEVPPLRESMSTVLALLERRRTAPGVEDQ